MKVIFLDIDGVLNSVAYDRERTPDQGNIDESRLPLLKRIVDESGAYIVLTSSWRKHWEREVSLCDTVGKELNDTFRKFQLQIADKTPLIGAGQRALEIQRWLDAHEGQVECFVILDDIFAGWGSLQSHLIKTDARIGRGLEQNHVDRALGMLNAVDT